MKFHLLRLATLTIALNLSPLPGLSQVTVGYSAITSVVGSALVDSTYRQRVTDQYAISGVNVEPVDGGNTFDRNTIWKIYDASKPWSLTIRDDSPRVDVNKEQANSQLVQAGRRESVYATVSGSLYGTIEKRTLSPFSSVQLPPIVPISTTVFP